VIGELQRLWLPMAAYGFERSINHPFRHFQSPPLRLWVTVATIG
jgi:hypothetical protein